MTEKNDKKLIFFLEIWQVSSFKEIVTKALMPLRQIE